VSFHQDESSIPKVLLLNHMEVGAMVRIKTITSQVWLTLSDKADFTVGSNDEIGRK